MSRLDACLSLMARDGIDVLVLGREANARTVSDAARLWLAGTRAFSPGCVVVRRDAAVHLLANTAAVVPPGFPPEHLYGLTWNPEELLASLVAIDGVREARRVAVDSMTPMANALLTRAIPDAVVVDAGGLFAELWSVADPEKVSGVEAAAGVAGLGFAAMRSALRAGATPRELRGVCAAQFAFLGSTTPAFEAVAAPFDGDATTWLPPEHAFADGERVVMRAGVLRDGWEASLARVYVVGTPPVEVAPPAGWADLGGACIPGASAGMLRARGAVVHGVGRGVEPWPDDLVLVPDLMVAIELHDDASLRQDIVRITDSAPALVT
jgi:Xaa-Pro aminopeptidase